MIISLYGPPGSGKTSVGRLLADNLGLPFYDLDGEIERRAGKTIPEIFAAEGEAGFRRRERLEALRLLEAGDAVAALGGGALLDGELRERIEAAGPVLCLWASIEVLAGRLGGDPAQRPLLMGETPWMLEALLAKRAAHYLSFASQLDTTGLDPAQAAWQAQVLLGRFHIKGLDGDCDVRAQPEGLDGLGWELRAHGLNGPVALVSDENVAAVYAGRAAASLEEAGYPSRVVLLAAGEQHKTIASVGRLWDAFLSAGLERGSTVVALGGGVVSDLAGFAAATFLRGLPWAVVPTSLLAMVDASLGGKTGADLPQGKNLVGAFHAPRLVLADPQLLGSLPPVELRCGMAEVVKHGVIGDADLFAACQDGGPLAGPGGQADWGEIVRRSMGVKVHVIQEDPFEKGRRAVLNFGHTVGHAVEAASGLRIRHGEAVSIGMVAETRLAEEMGLAEAGLAERLAHTLAALGLPVELPADLDGRELLAAVGVDKKRQAGKARFSLPVRIGEVSYGVIVEEAALCRLFSSCTGQT
jgi:3-dehydroquinate synthase